MKNEHFCLEMSLFLLNNRNGQKSKNFKATTSYCRYTGHVFLKVPILPCSSRSNSSPVYLFHFFHRIPRLNSLPVVILMSSISPILTRSFLGWDVWIFQQPRLMEQNMSSISSFRPGGLDFPLVSVHGNWNKNLK